MYEFLKKLINRGERASVSEASLLRKEFRSRHHQFKLLLRANKRVLEFMTEMEQALRGTEPFTIEFVRSHITRASSNVYQIIKHLDGLAPGKYNVLNDRFNEIQAELTPHVRTKPQPKAGPLVVPLEAVELADIAQVGPKLARLGEIGKKLQITTPPGFAVTAAGYDRFMGHNELQPEINRRIEAADIENFDALTALSEEIQQKILESELPEDLEAAILDAHGRQARFEGEDFPMAVRSSASAEDLPGTSFAGQFRSELNVRKKNICRTYKEILASKYSLTAMNYRLHRGLHDGDVVMCVGFLRMIDAVAGGVMYSRNPVDIRDDNIFINSVWGLPKSVCDGSTNSDLFVLSRNPEPAILKRTLADKEFLFTCNPDEGVCRHRSTGENRQEPSLTDAQALALGRLALEIEKHFGNPQDVEWALSEDGAILALQCRTLSQIRNLTDAVPLPGDLPLPAPILLRGGVTASPGVASGPVFRLTKDADALLFPDGAVLVAEQSNPRWAALLNRAAAVVTEQGSIAGHLANISREFDVPALFGITGALETLQDGLIITLDAETQTIYRGRIDKMLPPSPSRKNPMAGSPVFSALESAAGLILHLNLKDPDSPAFRPENCKTLHDITRFCHEKSVQEMFRFGKDHHFPERSSKQLIAEIPMRWWVLNLDNGFKEEVDGKYVHVDNIASVPMRALWSGITASPWEGPPPVDGRGIMSVMFHATTNRALMPTVRSRFSNRNYFMISKDYCSLATRLGFHFCTVEALVNERLHENYIRFQFKGGAADLDRKRQRVLFIGDILGRYGFRIDCREDTLLAGMENREQGLIENRLKILGYLTIHTRQLDMIMTNPASVAYYRDKIIGEIERLFSP